MAIFKILKGPSSRIDTGTTPFHEGYAYFTPDNNGFYIDAETEDGVQKRFHVNAVNITPITATLLASNWRNNQQTISVTGVTASSNGVVGLTETVSSAQFAAAQEASLHLTAQSNGAVTISVMGEVTPTVDIPIVFLLFD